MRIARGEGNPTDLIVPTLTPGLVCSRAVDARHFAIGEAQVDGELAAVMDLIAEQEPGECDAREFAGSFGSDQKRAVLQQLFFAVTANQVAELRVFVLERGDDLGECFRCGPSCAA